MSFTLYEEKTSDQNRPPDDLSISFTKSIWKTFGRKVTYDRSSSSNTSPYQEKTAHLALRTLAGLGLVFAALAFPIGLGLLALYKRGKAHLLQDLEQKVLKSRTEEIKAGEKVAAEIKSASETLSEPLKTALEELLKDQQALHQLGATGVTQLTTKIVTELNTLITTDKTPAQYSQTEATLLNKTKNLSAHFKHLFQTFKREVDPMKNLMEDLKTIREQLQGMSERISRPDMLLPVSGFLRDAWGIAVGIIERGQKMEPPVTWPGLGALKEWSEPLLLQQGRLNDSGQVIPEGTTERQAMLDALDKISQNLSQIPPPPSDSSKKLTFSPLVKVAIIGENIHSIPADQEPLATKDAHLPRPTQRRKG